MKLVRDCIPEIIEEDGNWCLTRTVLNAEEHIRMLRDKMSEEVQEFIENPCYEEAADMLEVVKAFCYLNNLEWDSVLGAAVDKEERRGGFYNGIILQKVGSK